MEFFPLSIFKVKTKQKIKILDHLYISGIKTVKDFLSLNKDQILIDLKLKELDLYNQYQQLDEQVKQLKQQFVNQEIKLDIDEEFIDSDFESQNNNRQQDSKSKHLYSIPLIFTEENVDNLVDKNQQKKMLQKLTYFNYDNQSKKKQILSQLNNIINYGELTEIYGGYGCGKTQLLMQILKNFFIMEQNQVNKSQAFIIDFEGSFTIKRFLEFSKNSFQNLNVNQKQMLENILIFKQFVKETNIKLLILDGFLNFVKFQKDKYKDKYNRYDEIKEINLFLEDLQQIAEKLNCAVIFTNNNNIQYIIKNRQLNKIENYKPEFSEEISYQVQNRISLQKMKNDLKYFKQNVQDQQQVSDSGNQINQKLRNKEFIMTITKASNYIKELIEIPINLIFTQNDGVQFKIE
ncbi:P-loop containing nucleoside triphosphate hydrolase [Pseudocohnilembus persalinus]|uniref:p-loop containing nucleoside triphosphate hydrolase n=1 Tax=Pseudocohnilembus persalinus TaxID=266149 RepID=A0A0V0QK66_PSEPJ|nr:P-loop containing nucleoside triphosphate hydrolase [Pseudocohnilembus persalinus]|eukprot:KRX02603.1 P-loop containing nucleoside triphosphate hydrolase [Pseudocohnilembus persalinus]